MKKEIMTHEQMVARMLKNPAVQAEHERLNKEEFAIRTRYWLHAVLRV